MDVRKRHAGDPEVIAAATGLVNFLREVVQNSTQQIRDDRVRSREHLWLAQLPEGVRRPTDRQDGLLVTLDHVPRAVPPPLPEVLEGWVAPDRVELADGGDPPLAEEGPGKKRESDADGRTWWEERTVQREDAAEVLRAYGSWLQRWRRWAHRERADRTLRDQYEFLYRWHQLLSQQDDQQELVLAVGLLTWKDPNGESVHRHLLTRRVETAVERRTARLTVRLASESSLRVEDRDFLDSDDGWDPERSTAVAEDLEARSPHPLSDVVLEQLPQWQERALSRPTAFSAEWVPPGEPEAAAQLTYAPALILRPRDRNALLRCYEQIAASVATEEHAPLGLAQLVLTLDAEERAQWTSDEKPPLFGDDPLFPLKTNAQQRDVLRRLERDTGVVVQGPPGTGKTHTIANLVSALLAQGQRVLVTSARDQPLTVLRDKLPPSVRDLCVLLLSSTRQDGTSELERTINALTDQVAASDIGSLRGEIDILSTQRDGVRARIATLTGEVIELREAETRHHEGVAPGYEGTLAAIVQRVQDREPQYGWMGTLPDGSGVTPPLSSVQAEELLTLLREELGQIRAGGALPVPDELPSAHEVAETLAASRLTGDGLSREVVTTRDVLAGLDVSVTDQLTKALSECRTALHNLGVPAAPAQWGSGLWITQALEDRLARRNVLLWQRVAAGASELASVRRGVDSLGLRDVSLPDGLSKDGAGQMVRSGSALRNHLAGGRKLRTRLLSRVQKEAQELLDSCTVDGRPPTTPEELDAVLAHLQAHTVITTVAGRWEQVGASLPDGPIEVGLAVLAERYEQLAQIDTFGTSREQMDKLLVSEGVHIALTSRDSWQHFADAVTALDGRRTADEAMARLSAWEERLRTPVEGTHPASEALAVAQAIREGDVERYAKEFDGLASAYDREHRTRRCSELLDVLRSAHPVLAALLAEHYGEPEWDSRLGEFGEAWAWARAASFVRRRRTPGLEQRIEGELVEQEERLERLTGDLAGLMGRLHCLERMTQAQRSSLQAYRSHMSSYGKGKGRHAGMFKAAAREAMQKAMEAVPAWVTPIGQVAEMVQAKRDAFDVVIVDEASQAGMDALFLLWLAPRVIVVGDDKQCAPSLSGMGRTQAIQDRLTAHLPEVPLSLRQLYTPHTNLYQLLSTFFPEVIRLGEHFRCMPEIIAWSSKTFYDDKLVPLRQFGGERLQPLLTHFVEGAVTEGREGRLRNPKEAEAIVDCLAEMVKDPAYRDKSMGVIVLQGQGQIRLLDDLIKQRLPATVRERHAIRVGNPASFQGDERHVIMLSMVVTEPARITGGQRSERQAYNVAASRAQDQMRLFYSVHRGHLKSGDLRLNLLTYMENPPEALAADNRIGPVAADVLTAPFDSLFEQQVYLRLKERGYYVIPQFPAGEKRIDLVVIGPRGRLAVECDGDYYHSTPEQIRRDQQRERELQRAGWKFWRVRESEFRFDTDAALAGLWEELERQGIHPADYARPQNSRPQGGAWVSLDLSADDILEDDAEEQVNADSAPDALDTPEGEE
ncbi:AAA domain-containing protein [Actinacidiphila sp. ITFR-21]|uniref:AAA domain-containing protein n=1 Tax=Actinacidiphila sp. ITFR-21 TaxID=3075199 RepID=UPI0028897C9A|nr:AAA domain-containing protein [Streptomyces sp. ITFR-21]WNI16382.1 AAA domain-containing protein [Streptomyces sp. ITFR-21]